MTRGRKPVPTTQLKLRGTYRPVRHGKRRAEPQATGSLAELEPPIWLDGEQREEWVRLVRDAPRGVLVPIDSDILASYCELLTRYRRMVLAQNERDKDRKWPYLIENAKGEMVISPYVHTMNRCITMMLSLQSELGLTPASRTRIAVPPAEPTSDSTWDRIAQLRLITGGLGKPLPAEAAAPRADDDATEDEPPAA